MLGSLLNIKPKPKNTVLQFHPLMRVFAIIGTSLICLASSSLAQKFTISGTLSDAGNGERLIGANVYNKENPLQGTTANTYGFYSLTLPAGEYIILYTFVGYQPIAKQIKLDKNIDLDVSMAMGTELGEVEIIASQTEKIQERSEMSVVEIPMAQIKMIPALLGERDIIKAIQLMPGVQSGGEGTSGLYVRGGGPDQNLILLDGVPVYNASHLFGFFSVFNTDAINTVTLTKGGFPARYGGRLSSVLDIRMKEGSSKGFKAEGSIGIVASRLTIEGPIGKNEKTSFIVSGRRTYIDLLAQPIIKAASKSQGASVGAGYFFYDLNAKVNHTINANNRIFLSAYTGTDKAYANYKEKYYYDGYEYNSSSRNALKWGNITTALRWNSIINKKLFANTTLTYSRYKFDVGLGIEDSQTKAGVTETSNTSFNYFSGIDDWAGKIDFDYIPNTNHYIKFGVSDIYHTFKPGVTAFKQKSGSDASLDTTLGSANIFAHEAYAYVEDDIKIGARLKVNIGAALAAFVVKKKNYYSLQPRVSGRFLLTDNLSIKGSYAQMTQFIHLLTNSNIGLPTDLWVPTTDSIPPQQAWQVAAGFAYTFKKEYEVSIEGYYKPMTNLIEYKEGASFFSQATNWDQKVEIGKGLAYGVEFLIQKKVGKNTGWIGYTLSWSTRQFDNINFGEEFFYRYDRRHDISIVYTRKIGKRADLGITWVYGTGNAVTLPTSRYSSLPDLGNGQYFDPNYSSIEYFNKRNGFRAPAYHRLDIGYNIHKQTKWGTSTWSIGLYNAYSRRNPFYLFFSQDYNGNRVLKQISLFPMIPSVAWSFQIEEPKHIIDRIKHKTKAE